MQKVLFYKTSAQFSFIFLPNFKKNRWTSPSEKNLRRGLYFITFLYQKSQNLLELAIGI